jgi:hypothetical protein
MQLLRSGYKRLKVLIHIFHHYIDSNFLLYVHNVFKINFYKKILFIILYIFYNPKFKKLNSVTTTFGTCYYECTLDHFLRDSSRVFIIIIIIINFQRVLN